MGRMMKNKRVRDRDKIFFIVKWWKVLPNDRLLFFKPQKAYICVIHKPKDTYRQRAKCQPGRVPNANHQVQGESNSSYAINSWLITIIYYVTLHGHILVSFKLS